MSHDIFDAYEHGVIQFLTDLEHEVGIRDPIYQDALNLQSRLHENIYEARQFGDTNELESQRNQILHELNRFCSNALGRPFNKYYLGETETRTKTRAYEEAIPFVGNVSYLAENEDQIQEIARKCSERGFSPEDTNILIQILRSVDTPDNTEDDELPKNKEQTGDQNMPLDITENPFRHSAQVLGQYLIQLRKYHSQWSELNLADEVTDRSLDLLEEIKNRVLVTKPFVDRKYKSKAIDLELSAIVNATRNLKDILMRTDQTLLLHGEIPFDDSDEIEKYFNDITYYLAKYLLVLNSIEPHQGNAHWVQ